ncbi:alpha/beta hydrolase [Sulfitobacter sp. S190]|uniref:alpha/beta hydrolase n=1 Tax=Sulfitobacter sp. S190 TaxID=2867022 RepID=UPI0021A548E6|nr:alpha/beta hydrolase [Sulfitobacter sp. S190]UWR24534.1 alpha/beta hydrolase [Sulfitobacter sp. S190]
MTYHYEKDGGAVGAPLVFTFHGTGGDETQFHGFARQLYPDATVISPRGDVSEHGANRFFRRTGEGVYDMDDLAARRDALAAFVEDQHTDVAPARVIGLGYSNGANILAALSFERPDLFDEMVLMHPLIPWQPAPQPALSGKRILLTAGRNDPICPAPQTTALVSYFEGQGARVETVWHPGGHEIARSEIEAIAAFAGTVKGQ